MIIIGITGTIGAGKGVAADYLAKQKGFSHFSVRTFLIEEARKQGLESDRDTLIQIANGLRRGHGSDIIARKMYEQAAACGKNSVIESIRSPGEVSFLRKQKDFILMAVDSDIELRYKRIVKRGSNTDHVSFEKFKEDEEREMTSTDLSSPNLRRCIELADIRVSNDGSLADLYADIERSIISVLDGQKI